MGGNKVRRVFLNSVRGLANNFDVADNSVLNLPLAFQSRRVTKPLNIARDVVDGFRDVLQIIFGAKGMLDKGWAVCRTTSRNFTGRSLGVITDTSTPSSC